MNEEKLFGQLFNVIPLLSENHLDTLLETLDKEHAIYFLVQAVKYAHNQGTYSLGESEILSKSIRVLSKENI